MFSFIGGDGHFRPLIPVARAAEAAGHEVVVAGGGTMVAAILRAGFAALATSEIRATVPDPPREPIAPVDLEAENRTMREGFAGRGARRYAEVLPGFVRSWKPDVLVRDEVDFGAAAVAELLGVPCATVLVLAAGTFLYKNLVADPLHELRADLGLPYDADLAMLDRDLVLSPFPPSFRSPKAPLPPTAFSYRAAAPTTAPASVPAPTAPERRTQRPTVYFTLGTYPTNPEIYARVLAGLSALEADVVMTVGESIDPAEFGPQPDHIRIARFIPQEDILARCDLVVSHAGSGSLIGTLAHGLPTVLLPMGADQPHNAERCAELGVGQVLDAATATSEQVRDAVATTLADERYRRAAERIRNEVNTLPDVGATIPLIEQLV
jgi:UDP:flavonoid glycosyltransferase YjiC (YdhE family)